jgi:hypothetical protein
MKTRIAAALVAALTLSATMVAGSSQAQARHWGWGGFGLGLALGSAAAATYVYNSPCHWVRQFDRFGNYVGRVRVCDY